MQQRRLGSSVGVALLLVLAPAPAPAVGPDDPPVVVALDVGLALAAGEGAGGELFDQALVVAAQAFYLVLVKCWACLAWLRGGLSWGCGVLWSG